jgi:hypothetical protein
MEHKSPRRSIRNYHEPAGGWGALKAVATALNEQDTAIKGGATLLRMNQPEGFDCPGCAWPDPKHTSSFEFCENGPGPMVMHGGSGPITRGGPMTTAPVRGPVQGWNGPRNNFAGMRDHHGHFHNRHNRNFFAFGFGGPYYDYAYDSCWTQVQTYYGWQWVNVCSDYGY